jgi:hypothetical protein
MATQTAIIIVAVFRVGGCTHTQICELRIKKLLHINSCTKVQKSCTQVFSAHTAYRKLEGTLLAVLCDPVRLASGHCREQLCAISAAWLYGIGVVSALRLIAEC